MTQYLKGGFIGMVHLGWKQTHFEYELQEKSKYILTKYI